MNIEQASSKVLQLLNARGHLSNSELVGAVDDDLELAQDVRHGLVRDKLAVDGPTGLAPAPSARAEGGPGEPAPEGAWIFVSHSHRDLEEVRRVRNALEAKGHNPLLFFLRCLDDNAELDDLIRREIEARTWFLLCDSPNARNSKWVQMELEYIRGLPGKYTANVDLTHDWDEQLAAVTGLSRRVTIYMAYSREDQELVRPIAEALRQHEYRVYFDDDDAAGVDLAGIMRRSIETAAAEGFILLFVSEAGLRSEWVEYEYKYALEQGGMVVPVTIGPAADGGAAPGGTPLREGDQAMDFTTGSFQENMQTLLRVLKTKNMDSAS
ncbi:toll/interleukin-1 receptor domain-containing protein [bacterium]|nr:toll/interleukin-1 receptor domain-containing protein [bacterium]